jgi:AcrR family transcriptional regulator
MVDAIGGSKLRKRIEVSRTPHCGEKVLNHGFGVWCWGHLGSPHLVTNWLVVTWSRLITLSMHPQKDPARMRDATAAREALLDAAQTAFANSGFSGARIDDIAKSSGYNKSLIFQYFSDKAGLYQAVVRRLRETSDAASAQELGEVVCQDTTLDHAQLEVLIRASVAWSFAHLRSEPEYLKLFAWEMAEGWKAFQAIDMVEQSTRWGVSVLKSSQSRMLCALM